MKMIEIKIKTRKDQKQHFKPLPTNIKKNKNKEKQQMLSGHDQAQY